MGDYDDYEENDLQYELASDGKLYPFMKIENGQGTAVFGNNGDTYTGEYQNFKRHGKGEYKFSNGAVYTGDYIEGIKSGKGIFTAPDGGKYEGDWQQDKRWGMGTYTYPNGDRYEGKA